MNKRMIAAFAVAGQILCFAACRQQPGDYLGTAMQAPGYSAVQSEAAVSFPAESFDFSEPESEESSSLPESIDTKSLAAKPENQIPVKGKSIAKDPAYQATEKELEEEDPGYLKNREKQDGTPVSPNSSVAAPPPAPSEAASSQPASSGSSSTPSSPETLSSGAEPSAPAASSSSPPASSAIPDGWQVLGGNTYFYRGGSPLKGWNTFGDRKYFFDGAGILKTRFGIDVSVYQPEIDWAAAKADGVEFAIIRVGFRGYGAAGNLKIDSKFTNHVKKARANNLKIGVYFYTQAVTADEAVQEANFVLRALSDEGLNPSSLAYPVIYDIEEAATQPGDVARTVNLNNRQRTDFCIAFAETVRAAGYRPMIYSNKYWLTSKLETSRLSAYDIWLAHYMNPLSKTTDYTGAFKMWQYTSSGTVRGISGNVDMNVSFY